MNLPEPEKRRVKVTSGTLPAFKITSLAACHPFSQQLDVVLPLDQPLLSTLEALKACYGKGKARLSDVLKNAHTFVNSVEGERHTSSILVTSTNPHEDDVWCIDPRGHLTLSVAKETYERLGLMGQKLPYKNLSERYAIDLPLRKNSQSAAIRAKQMAALELWDKIREAELGKDAGLWDIVCCSKDQGLAPDTAVPFQPFQLHSVGCKRKDLQDVHVPVISLSSRPKTLPKGKTTKHPASEQDEDIVEDWKLHVESLFEWVGMACLGSQRLHANDRVDPYVAIYDHPTPSDIRNVTHLQWRGLLSPAFVKEVLDSLVATLHDSSSSLPFVGVTCHALTTSPVSYMPYIATKTGALQKPEHLPVKLPRADGEDTWSLILESPSQIDDGSAAVRWCLTESVGQWDSRWG